LYIIDVITHCWGLAKPHLIRARDKSIELTIKGMEMSIKGFWKVVDTILYFMEYVDNCVIAVLVIIGTFLLQVINIIEKMCVMAK